MNVRAVEEVAIAQAMPLVFIFSITYLFPDCTVDSTIFHGADVFLEVRQIVDVPFSQ